MIFKNAKDIPLNSNSGTLPDVSAGLLNWFQKMVFTKIVKTVENFRTIETATDISFQGVWQAANPENLKMMPNANTSWSWFQLHAEPSLVLVTDEVVKYLGKSYRVMSKLDHSKYGYVEYMLIEDYTGSGPEVAP